MSVAQAERERMRRIGTGKDERETEREAKALHEKKRMMEKESAKSPYEEDDDKQRKNHETKSHCTASAEEYMAKEMAAADTVKMTLGANLRMAGIMEMGACGQRRRAKGRTASEDT